MLPDLRVISHDRNYGKSTALRCIDRLERIDQGRIQVCGHEVSDPKLDLRQLRRDVGIVFQSYNLFPHLTVGENIMLAPRLANFSQRHPDLDVLAQWRERSPGVRLVHSTRLSVVGKPEPHAARLRELHIDAVNLHHADWSGGMVALK